MLPAAQRINCGQSSSGVPGKSGDYDLVLMHHSLRRTINSVYEDADGLSKEERYVGFLMCSYSRDFPRQKGVAEGIGKIKRGSQASRVFAARWKGGWKWGEEKTTGIQIRTFKLHKCSSCIFSNCALINTADLKVL